MDRVQLVTDIKEDLLANWEQDINGCLVAAGGDIREYSDEERNQIVQGIENGLEFTREVLNVPTILDHIPDGSQVEAVFRENRDPNKCYDIETPRMVAIVTPPDRSALEPPNQCHL